MCARDADETGGGLRVREETLCVGFDKIGWSKKNDEKTDVIALLAIDFSKAFLYLMSRNLYV